MSDTLGKVTSAKKMVVHRLSFSQNIFLRHPADVSATFVETTTSQQGFQAPPPPIPNMLTQTAKLRRCGIQTLVRFHKTQPPSIWLWAENHSCHKPHIVACGVLSHPLCGVPKMAVLRDLLKAFWLPNSLRPRHEPLTILRDTTFP